MPYRAFLAQVSRITETVTEVANNSCIVHRWCSMPYKAIGAVSDRVRATSIRMKTVFLAPAFTLTARTVKNFHFCFFGYSRIVHLVSPLRLIHIDLQAQKV